MTKLDQNAEVIQGQWRVHQRRKAKGAKTKGAKGNSPGVLSKLARSLSFSKRNKGKEGSTPRANDAPAPVQPGASTGSQPSPDTPGETGATPKRRSLSFTRKKKPVEADESVRVT